MKIRNKFTLAENPQRVNDELFIIHHHQPIAHIRVWHEAISFDNSIRTFTFNFKNTNNEIETITFELTHCFFSGKLLPDAETDNRLNKLMNYAMHWYTAYLNWEDQNLET